LIRPLELIITGRVIDAQEAKRIGLVNEVVPKGKSLERALELEEIVVFRSLPSGQTKKQPFAVWDSRWLKGCGSKRSASIDLFAIRLPRRACANSVSEIIRIAASIEARIRQVW
jgi:enoyl-CoA hydratase/carnithine racemase